MHRSRLSQTLIYDEQDVRMPRSAWMHASGLSCSRCGLPVLSRHKYIPVQNCAFLKARALPERKISDFEIGSDILWFMGAEAGKPVVRITL